MNDVVDKTPPLNRRYIGYLDGPVEADSLVIYGWAGCVEDAATPVLLEVFAGETLLGHCYADRSRADLVLASGQSLGKGFVFSLPEAMADGRMHEISIRIANTRLMLGNSPLSLTLPVSASRHNPIQFYASRTRFRGLLDSIDPVDIFTLYGWVIPEDDVTKNALVDILVDGELLGSVRCDQQRPDVDDLFGPGALGFAFRLPFHLFDGHAHEIVARVTNTDIELANSPLKQVFREVAPYPVPVKDRQPPQAALCAIARNEAHAIVEWIAYHKVIGFQNMVIYENSSTDGTNRILKALHQAGEITVHEWPDLETPNRQIHAYSHFQEQYRARFDWVLCLDIDEFLVLKNHQTVGDFLKQYPDAQALSLSWRFFGSGGQDEPDDRLVIERFTSCAADDFASNRHFKTIFRPDRARWFGVHAPALWDDRITMLNGQQVGNLGTIGMHLTPCYTEAWVNHYFVKSRAEWTQKVRRGRADTVDQRDIDRFEYYDRNECSDTTILRFGEPLKAEYQRLVSLI